MYHRQMLRDLKIIRTTKNNMYVFSKTLESEFDIEIRLNSNYIG